ncbi:hypothetical protein BCR39DRAFT_543229 [Naematelia encephala]|uniref:HTH APSES-type domain-containing protein n=1 Tax=Naematelia encephala TaxID=71784 RepID=A0A1Y2AT56_9TREE|nr:hypothetical protein BCR39DRAFT_543229 [Naematelia encephala]
MGKKPVAVGGDNGPNTIFKATYSGVPVYEMICRSVAVMRRRSDAYLNATQILKVAGFDKPQRTRVLEREVQKGEHEKVQGGYGKYQGTWIPIERGLALAKQYGVEDLLRPIIDYVATSVSPPPAPKHIVAPPTKIKKDKDGKAVKDGFGTPLKTGPMSAAALQAQAQLSAQRSAGKRQTRAVESTPDPDTSPRSPEDSADASGEIQDEESSSATPSPVASMLGVDTQQMEVDGMLGEMAGRKRGVDVMLEEDLNQYEHLRRARGQSAVHTPRASPRPLGLGMGMDSDQLGPEAYTDIILNYFISETAQIPSILVNPPADYEPDTRIDDDGHTALHWACAMGRIRVVKLLLTAGASIFTSNNSEQTPLMRSVMFGNNYDVRKFPELYELLHRSTLNIDRHNRTVFHHIANLALTKGKTHAAWYYMETILSRLADYPQELADVINFQDEDGETALSISARARSKRLVTALLDHGADPKIKNRDFKSAEDYILEDERFRSSPVGGRDRLSNVLGDKAQMPQLYTSEAARLAGGSSLNDIASHMQDLAKSFDAELQGKERDILQAKALLNKMHTEVTEASRSIAVLHEQAAPLGEAKHAFEGLQSNLKTRVDEVLRAGFEEWIQGEEGREERWRSGQDAGMNGEDYSDLPVVTDLSSGTAEEWERLRWELDEKRRNRESVVGRYIRAQAEAGTGEKIRQYRKLIVAASGGSVATSELDQVMTQLLETLEGENSSTGYGVGVSNGNVATMRTGGVGVGGQQAQRAGTNVQWMAQS